MQQHNDFMSRGADFMTAATGPNYGPEQHNATTRTKGLQTSSGVKFFSLNTDVTKPDVSITCAPAGGSATANAASLNGQLRLNGASIAPQGRFLLPNVPGVIAGTGSTYAFGNFELVWDDSANKLCVVKVSDNTKKSTVALT
jgi:hypothetical protein